MAEIAVKRKSGVPWWVWLIGALLIIVILWYFLGGRDQGPVADGSDSAPAAGAASTVSNSPAPKTSALDNMAAPAGTAGGERVGGEVVSDPGVYGSTADKLSLAGRQAAFSSVQLARVVGPKTFTIASGSDELLVMVDQGLDRGVGSQGQIDPGRTLNVKGTFERLQQEEIDNISNNRFRELTELERDTLRKKQVYLRATEFGGIN